MYYIVDNNVRELARMLVSRPGLAARVMVDGKIDKAKLRIELSREAELHESAVQCPQNGLRPRVNHGGGPKGRTPSPSPWSREHPKWDPK